MKELGYRIALLEKPLFEEGQDCEPDEEEDVEYAGESDAGIEFLEK